MARDGEAVDPELAAAVASFVAGRRLNVKRRCVELGVSRSTFYKYVVRFRRRGVPGLFPDSRRPLHSPTKLPAALEDVLVGLRKAEDEAGWDYGADAVLLRLEEQQQHLWPVDRALPSRATVNRVFDARGQLARVPQRRPRRPGRRFERAEVNALWQFDGFDYRLATGGRAVVLHLSDDCSRVDLALQVATSENRADVWATFCTATIRYGLPAQVLTDNGTAFSGRRRGWTSEFEQSLDDLGIVALCSAIKHPQTCGKNERAHQRVQKWLARRPPAADLAGLQALLDSYREQYNSRRNQVLNGLTPNQRFDLGPIVGPDPNLQTATLITRHHIAKNGSIGLDSVSIAIGKKHAGNTATAFRNGDRVSIFVDEQLNRQLVIDRTRYYQPRFP